jgi:5-methylcytosine-specific restriction endonuclease McrA
MEHALRNASRKDVERIAHAVVDGAKEWLDKPAYEKGESLGRATTAIASEVAIDVVTDGLGTVATLRKVEKVAEAADHVRDAEKVIDRADATVERAGKPFTRAGKREVRVENAATHGGQTICVDCGSSTVPAKQSQRGVTPPANETHVDHIVPRSKGGAGSVDNGQVLCRDCNLKKGAR